MKITKAQLKKIILEELSEVSGVDTAPLGAEYTPMMPPRESFIAATVGSIINGLRSGKLSAQGAADRLESEVKNKLYKLRLEEGELEEMFDMSGKGSGPGHEASHAEKRKKKKTGPDHEEKMRKDREKKRRLHTRGY